MFSPIYIINISHGVINHIGPVMMGTIENKMEISKEELISELRGVKGDLEGIRRQLDAGGLSEAREISLRNDRASLLNKEERLERQIKEFTSTGNNISFSLSSLLISRVNIVSCFLDSCKTK